MRPHEDLFRCIKNYFCAELVVFIVFFLLFNVLSICWTNVVLNNFTVEISKIYKQHREMPEDERVDSLLGIVIECHVRRQFFYESCCPPLLRKWAFILRNEINDAR